MSPNERHPFYEITSHEVEHFIESQVIVGDLTLPYHYPRTNELEAWQVGFRSNGLTGESLVSTTPGAWQPGWYVIARNYFDDPFFIDVNEKAANFPVYYAPHGAGSWDASVVAPSIQRFSQILSALCGLEEAAPEALLFLETETDMSVPFWSEVHEERRSRECEEEPVNTEADYDTSELQHGTLVITDVGSQKLKIVQILRQVLDLSLAEALALAAQREIVVGSGFLIRLRHLQEKLIVLGASVEFRPKDETAT